MVGKQRLSVQKQGKAYKVKAGRFPPVLLIHATQAQADAFAFAMLTKSAEAKHGPMLAVA